MTDQRDLAPQVPFSSDSPEPLPEIASTVVRYDADRQLSQVLQDGQWVDSTDAAGQLTATT